MTAVADYRYRAKDGGGGLREGVIAAESVSSAAARLGALGWYPLSLTKAHAPTPDTRSIRASRAAVAWMTRSLADLLGSGLTLMHALAVVRDQMQARDAAALMDALSDRLRDGVGFSEALACAPAAFSPVYVAVVRAGELGGTLEQSLGRLADLAQEDEALRHRVQGALIYPALILTVGLATVLFLLAYVIPTLSLLFEEAGQTLPWPTRVVLAASRTVVSCGWWAMALLVVAVVAASHPSQRPRLKTAGDRWVLRLPLAGSLVRRVHIAQWASALSLLLAQGVPMLQALHASSQTIANGAIRSEAAALVDGVRTGCSLTGALRQCRAFPPFVADLVAVGEQGGTLERALAKVSEAYQRQAGRLLHWYASLLEPLMILGVGLVVGLVVVAMLLPIFQLDMLAQ